MGGGYFWPMPQSNTTTSSSGAQVAALAERAHGGERGAALGRDVGAHQPPGEPLRLGQRVLAHRYRGASAGPQRVEDQRVAHRRGHAQAAGAGGGALPALGAALAALEGAHDRRAALGLHGDIRGRSGPIQPSASSSSKAFHMPIRPVPPPVG